MHSISHDNEEEFWSNGTVETWALEMGGQRDMLAAWANIAKDEIYGSRSPLLR